ncbi:MAG TPA: hypothetical protein VN456_00315, partial [Desulfosporosinus sp.]|nr:hypothetical protein [Desulfosporosinus sp.]
VPVMALSVVIPSFVGIAQADPVTKTVYVDVEKNVLHGNLLKEPVKVELSDTSTILDATKQAYGASGVDASAGYIAAFADTNTAFTYDYEEDIRDATNDVVYRTDLDNQPIVSDSNWLRETEYNGISGWMFTVNNAVADGSYNYYTAATPLSALPDGAVIRWEFSEAFGADLGMTGAYVPIEATATEYYNWNTAVPFAPLFTRADKTILISKMADHANKTDTAYTNALNELKTLISTQSNVNTKAAAL